ncbi:unnamed protein product [Litomosoides sigmodontis]|uniref:Uncharacterized protein n=1 Tax=Litomosoides sigmodontis TaxID=42156 RepID=A0A3P6SVL8_LITSI|nr:unnamed protein product [Litomosoides sigmodontis]
MRSGSTDPSSHDFTRNVNGCAVFGFDSIPLIIEVAGIITTATTCLLMHFILKDSYEDTSWPTFHHLIHNQYYSKQLDRFLNDLDRKKDAKI